MYYRMTGAGVTVHIYVGLKDVAQVSAYQSHPVYIYTRCITGLLACNSCVCVHIHLEDMVNIRAYGLVVLHVYKNVS